MQYQAPSLHAYLVTRRPQEFANKANWKRFATEEECKDFLEDLNTICVDVETNGLGAFLPGAKLLLVQLGNKERQYVIDRDTIDLEQFRPYLEDTKRKYIGHNLMFDFVWLSQNGIILRTGTMLDTQIAEMSITRGLQSTPVRQPNGLYVTDSEGSIVYKNVRTSLDYCVDNHLGIKMSKDERDDILKYGVWSEAVIEYSARDLLYLEDLLEKQSVIIQKKEVEKDFEEECLNIAPIGYVEISGIYLNYEGKDVNDYSWMQRFQESQADFVIKRHIMDQLHDDLTPGLATRLFMEKHYPDLDISTWDPKTSIRAWVKDNYPEVPFRKFPQRNHRLNWSSPDQVIRFFKEIGVSTFDDKAKKHTVDSKFLKRQRDPKGYISKYLQYMARAKDVSTYGTNWAEYIMPDGRIHSKYRLEVSTSRMACGNVSKGPFPNLQNVPNDPLTRSCFRGQGANRLICADFSDQEGRVLADRSGDPGLIDFYIKGKGDKHATVASMIYKVPVEAILAAKKKSKEELTARDKELLQMRQNAKAANFAIAYGGDGYTIANNLGIDIDEGRRIEKEYLDAFPGLREYFKKQRQFVWDNGYILVNPQTGKKVFIDRYEEWKRIDGLYGKAFRLSNKEFWQTMERWASPDKARQKHPGFANKTFGKRRAELIQAREKYWRYWNSKKNSMGRLALNYPIQGTAAIMTKRAVRYFYEENIANKLSTKSRGAWGKIKIANIVHDEVVVEEYIGPDGVEITTIEAENNAGYFLERNKVDNDTVTANGGVVLEAHQYKAETLTPILKECMERAGKELCPNVPMIAEPEVDYCWVH